MTPHFGRPVRFNFEVAARTAGAQEHKTCLTILLIVGHGRGLVDLTLQKASGAGQAAPLVTNGGECNSCPGRGIPDKFFFPALDGRISRGGMQQHVEGHATDYIRDDSYYTERGPARRVGSVPKAPIYHRAHEPATR